MLPACLRLADDVFPRVRAHAARRLVEAGWSQSRTGQALGLSQAMVSKHLASPPPADALVERLADELAQEALQPEARDGASPWCTTLTEAQGRPDAEAALKDFLGAERALLAEPPLLVVPQVGLNLALALPGADGPADVLAFPGRLVEAAGRLVRPAPPAFGGSGHLARVLLAVRRRTGHAALANVRGGADVLAKARRLGWTLQAVERDANAADEATLLRAIAAGRKPVDAVHDPGAVGLEACLYVAGPDAQAVAKKILALNQALVDP
ncbi:MAG: thiamine-phosphate synthase family protein [Candidatus Thermoplasmatota archaeon]